NAILNAHHEFHCLLGSGDDRWRVPRRADAGGAPQFLAVLLVQCNDGAAFDAGVDEESVLVNDRRRARSPAVRLLPYRDVPEFLAVQVEAVNAGLAEENVEALAVQSRRARGVAVVGAFALVLVFGQCRLEFLGPLRLAGRAIQTEEMTAQVFHLPRLLD